MELFEAHAVSFVSVTQSFNTTISMGRLTLNILLSFAQFEREVIGERVRDKIAASKRKGIWVGGPVPLGYAAVAKKVVVVPAEAETVRAIFARYLELASVQALAQDLDRSGIRSKPRNLADGRLMGGGPFGVGGLAHLLRNRFYIGEVVYRGETFRGDHEASDRNAGAVSAPNSLTMNFARIRKTPCQQPLRRVQHSTSKAIMLSRAVTGNLFFVHTSCNCGQAGQPSGQPARRRPAVCRTAVVIRTVINNMSFDGATKDPMLQAVRDALIAFMAATAQGTSRSHESRSGGRNRACQSV
jgi:hypothetical protein